MTDQPETQPSDPGQPRDPATDPEHDLTKFPQDPDAVVPPSGETVANTDEVDDDEDGTPRRPAR